MPASRDEAQDAFLRSRNCRLLYRGNAFGCSIHLRYIHHFPDSCFYCSSAGIREGLLPAIPVVLAAAFVITLFIYIFKSPVTAGLSTLIFTLIMMYLAGGLIPTEFLPSFLQKASVLNPFTYLIRFMLTILWR